MSEVKHWTLWLGDNFAAKYESEEGAVRALRDAHSADYAVFGFDVDGMLVEVIEYVELERNKRLVELAKRYGVESIVHWDDPEVGWA